MKYLLYIAETYHQIETCRYGYNYYSAETVDRIRIDLTVKIIDIDDKLVVAKTTIQGADPRTCDEKITGVMHPGGIASFDYKKKIYGASQNLTAVSNWAFKCCIKLIGNNNKNGKRTKNQRLRHPVRLVESARDYR